MNWLIFFGVWFAAIVLVGGWVAFAARCRRRDRARRAELLSRPTVTFLPADRGWDRDRVPCL